MKRLFGKWGVFPKIKRSQFQSDFHKKEQRLADLQAESSYSALKEALQAKEKEISTLQLKRSELEQSLARAKRELANLQDQSKTNSSQLKEALQEKEQALIGLQHEFASQRFELEAAFQEKVLLNRIGLAPYLDFSSFDFVTVLQAIIQNLETYYQIFMDARIVSLSSEWFRFFEFNCLSSYFSFPIENINSYLNEYKLKFTAQKDLSAIDVMEGHAFEHWCANLLHKIGFKIIEVTKGSGDQGGDIIAEKGGVRYAIQCKRYAPKDKVSNKAVQEVHAGKDVYKCHVSAVMTNTYFTASAKELADSTKTLLWDRDEIKRMLERVSIA